MLRSGSGTPRTPRPLRKVATQATVGPGAYDAKPAKGTGVKLAGSAAFRSTSEQRTRSFEWSDPGSFNLDSALGFGRLSTYGHNRGSKYGNLGFGSKSDRPAWGRTHPVHHAGPPPGAYDPRKPWRYGEKKQSAGFLTGTQRSEFILKAAKKNIPEPYLSHAPVKSQQKRVPGGESLFKGTPRFGVQATGQGSLGVGSYTYDNNTIAHSLRDFKAAGSGPYKVSAAFATNRRMSELFATPKIRQMGTVVQTV